MWVIDPATRVVTVVDAEGTRRRFRERDTLDGGDVVPGFMCDVASLFEGVARE